MFFSTRHLKINLGFLFILSYKYNKKNLVRQWKITSNYTFLGGYKLDVTPLYYWNIQKNNSQQNFLGG